MPGAFAPNFQPGEMRTANAPTTVQAALADLSWMLQGVRDAVGGIPMAVSSTYRTPEGNAALSGASDTSQHLDGTAADFVPVGVTLFTFMSRFLEAERQGKIPNYGQLVVYPYSVKPHIHISLATRGTVREKLVKLREPGYGPFQLNLLGAVGGGVIILILVAVALFLFRKGI
jgi:hypothetical protein